MQREPETWSTRPRVTIELVLRRAHRLEPLRQRERVAMITPRRYAVTPGGRVPRCLGPLDRRLVSHAPNLGPRCDSQETGFGGPTPSASVRGERARSRRRRHQRQSRAAARVVRKPQAEVSDDPGDRGNGGCHGTPQDSQPQWPGRSRGNDGHDSGRRSDALAEMLPSGVSRGLAQGQRQLN